MKIGLVLSGGGARGAAHIGAIRAIDEHGITISHVSGTSSGAIVGALYANDVPWKEMLNFFKTIPIFHTNRYAFNKPGFIDSENFYDDLKVYFPEDDFSVLKKTLYITATDIINGTLKIFNKGQLIKPIIASASFPGVFTPTKVNASYYVDGGTLNNFPVEPLEKMSVQDLKHAYTVVERAYKIKVASESLSKFSSCNLVIYPEALINYGIFDMKNIDAIYQVGYSTTKKILEDFKLIDF
jgi:NTE family protein